LNQNIIPFFKPPFLGRDPLNRNKLPPLISYTSTATQTTVCPKYAAELQDNPSAGFSIRQKLNFLEIKREGAQDDLEVLESAIILEE